MKQNIRPNLTAQAEIKYKNIRTFEKWNTYIFPDKSNPDSEEQNYRTGDND